jgi:hypothetical protein
MIDPRLLSETRLTLAQLAHRERVGIATVWRWTLNGTKGVRLESFKVGGRKFTTSEAFERFVAANNGGFSSQARVGSALSKQRLLSIEQAEAELADLR